MALKKKEGLSPNAKYLFLILTHEVDLGGIWTNIDWVSVTENWGMKKKAAGSALGELVAAGFVEEQEYIGRTKKKFPAKYLKPSHAGDKLVLAGHYATNGSCLQYRDYVQYTEKSADYSNEQEVSVPMSGHSGPISGGGDPTSGDSDPTRGQSDPIEGHIDPISGDGDPIEGHIDPTRGHTDPTRGHTDPLSSIKNNKKVHSSSSTDTTTVTFAPDNKEGLRNYINTSGIIYPHKVNGPIDEEAFDALYKRGATKEQIDEVYRGIGDIKGTSKILDAITEGLELRRKTVKRKSFEAEVRRSEEYPHDKIPKNILDEITRSYYKPEHGSNENRYISIMSYAYDNFGEKIFRSIRESVEPPIALVNRYMRNEQKITS
jgi:hypothetical protein